MELVVDDVGLGRSVLDDRRVRLRHVHADDAQSTRPILAELIEEAVQGLARPALAEPNHAPALQVANHGQVMVSPLVGRLVDADPADSVEAVPWQPGCHDSADDPLYGAPSGPEHAGGRGPVAHLHEATDQAIELVGMTSCRGRPRHRFDTPSVSSTVSLPDISGDERPHAKQIQVTPSTALAPELTREDRRAIRASRLGVSSTSNLNLHGVLLAQDLTAKNDRPLKPEYESEQADRRTAHVSSLSAGFVIHTEGWSMRRASFVSPELGFQASLAEREAVTRAALWPPRPRPIGRGAS